MSASNSNMVKMNKVNRYGYEEAQDRISKGKKLNKTKRQSKRDLWEDVVGSTDEV